MLHYKYSSALIIQRQIKGTERLQISGKEEPSMRGLFS